MAIRRFYLGDDERLSFGFDWSMWLREAGLAIANSQWVVPAEFTAVAQDTNGAVTTLVLEPGTAEVGDELTVTNIITTTGAQPIVAERSFVIEVVENKTE